MTLDANAVNLTSHLKQVLKKNKELSALVGVIDKVLVIIELCPLGRNLTGRGKRIGHKLLDLQVRSSALLGGLIAGKSCKLMPF